MKRIIFYLLAVIVVLSLVTPAHATLINRGTDTAGNRLIYDTYLDITWYDFTNTANTWDNHVSWADGLSVIHDSNTYDDWRLPTTVDDLYEYGTDGSTTGGFNITTSELGHLFYTDLGNLGLYDTSGNIRSVFGLSNTGDFQNLISYVYWSGTEYLAYTDDNAWYFAFESGFQSAVGKGSGYYGLAVRDGDVAAVPEPTKLHCSESA